MTEDMMALRGLMEKSADADLLREMIGFAATRLLELEVSGLTGAALGEKSPERLAQLEAQRKTLQTKLGKQERAKDTRRKVLLGAFILYRLEKGQDALG